VSAAAALNTTIWVLLTEKIISRKTLTINRPTVGGLRQTKRHLMTNRLMINHLAVGGKLFKHNEKRGDVDIASFLFILLFVCY
jgi:hypothetical protein